MSLSDGLVKRRVTNTNANHESASSSSNPQQSYQQKDDEPDLFDDDESNLRQTKLTLMEEIFLLGLKDKEGYTSFWNDRISLGLRCCILAELVLRKRIMLENAGRRISLSSRKVKVISTEHTGDALLDEALRHIQDTDPPNTFRNWVHYFSGETWVPFNLRFQLKNVRERIAKSLVEKGVLTTEKRNFLIFDMTTHPLINCPIKSKLISKVQDAVLNRWVSDPHKMDKRLLSLIVCATHSDVLENAFGPLSDDDFEMAMNRVRTLLDSLYMEEESCKSHVNDSLWGVLSAINS